MFLSSRNATLIQDFETAEAKLCEIKKSTIVYYRH